MNGPNSRYTLTLKAAASLHTTESLSGVAMDASKTILVCFLVVTPVTVYLSWKFWKWYMLQSNLEMAELGEVRRQQGSAPAV